MDKLAFPPEFDAQKAFAVPLGMMASPLWLAFAAAATAGAAFFWMNRWREATNLEAALVLPAQEVAKFVEAAEAVVEDVVEEVVEPVIEAAPEAVEEVLAVVEPEPIAETVLEPSDLTRLVGIGPKLAASLAERGVTRFEHIAAWTADDIAETDKALKLLGRIERDAWVTQAKRFAAEV